MIPLIESLPIIAKIIPMAKNITLLDGGMGREIKARLSSFDPLLWSASAFDRDDELIIDIHRDFIAAGATVITTNNYAVVPAILEQSKIPHQFENFTKKSALLANQARQFVKPTIKIAGSLPPLKSTYRPDLALPKEEAQPIYEQISSWLAPIVDYLFIESMSSIDEAASAFLVAKNFGLPIWISFILDDQNPGHLLSGEHVSLIPKHFPSQFVEAILFNCCHAISITEGLKRFNFDGRTGGYANAFTALNPNWTHGKLRGDDDRMTPEIYSSHARDWINNGASIIGGCCGIGPQFINHLHHSLLISNN